VIRDSPPDDRPNGAAGATAQGRRRHFALAMTIYRAAELTIRPPNCLAREPHATSTHSAIWPPDDWVRRLAEYLWWIVERRMFMLVGA
jgi:hypothetical protein